MPKAGRGERVNARPILKGITLIWWLATWDTPFGTSRPLWEIASCANSALPKRHPDCHRGLIKCFKGINTYALEPRVLDRAIVNDFKEDAMRGADGVIRRHSDVDHQQIPLKKTRNSKFNGKFA